MENQNYRVHAKIRRQGEAPLDDLKIEIKSENYDNDQDFVLAVAEELLEIISADREYMESLEG